MTWERIATRLDGDGPHAVSASGVDLVVVRTPGGLRAFEGRCPHQGALLGEGELEGGALVCRNHRWRFDPDTGKRLGGDACLVACPIKEEDGQVHVDASALVAAKRTAATKRTLDELPRHGGALPIVGNMHQIPLDHLHLKLEQWSRELGPFFTFKLGPTRALVVADKQLGEKVLRDRPETFRRESRVELIFEELQMPGVFSVEGAPWRPQRRLTMEALAQKNVRTFYPTLRAVAENLVARWRRAAAAGTEIDVKEDLKRFTVDVTTRLAFGRDVNTLDSGDDVIQRHLELVFPGLMRRLFAVVPYWRWFRMPRDRALDHAINEVISFLRELCVEARARLAADPKRAPANFLESMLSARDEHGAPFSEEIVLGNALQILLAGEDTTANTLAWAMHHLCDSPDDVAALRAEADALLGGELVAPDMDAAGKLAFAGAVANEAMRLRPVAPVVFLSSNVDTSIGDIAVPAGTAVALLTRVPALDAENFTDPTAFKPRRWIAPPAAHDVGASTPFGSGPRICPGRSLAMIEMRVVLATIYKAFDVARAGGEVTERYAFTMEPVGFRVRVAPRAAAAATARAQTA